MGSTKKTEISNRQLDIKKEGKVFYLGCNHRSIHFRLPPRHHQAFNPPLPPLPLPTLYQTSSYLIQPHSGVLVDAIREATNINLDILVIAFIPQAVAVTSENVFNGSRCWVWARGLESQLGSGRSV